jgi:hypothetical protein
MNGGKGWVTVQVYWGVKRKGGEKGKVTVHLYASWDTLMKRKVRRLFSNPIEAVLPPCKNAATMYSRMTG